MLGIVFEGVTIFDQLILIILFSSFTFFEIQVAYVTGIPRIVDFSNSSMSLE